MDLLYFSIQNEQELKLAWLSLRFVHFICWIHDHVTEFELSFFRGMQSLPSLLPSLVT